MLTKAAINLKFPTLVSWKSIECLYVGHGGFGLCLHLFAYKTCRSSHLILLLYLIETNKKVFSSCLREKETEREMDDGERKR